MLKKARSKFCYKTGGNLSGIFRKMLRQQKAQTKSGS
jgi:hypothetical protein